MSRREAWASAALVFLVAVAVRSWASTVITFPRPEDTAYYVGVARNLIEGRGLVSDAIWSFGTPPLEFPRPAFEVWLPLPTFLAALPMALLGTTFAAAQWSSIFVGGLVAVLAWRLAADVAAERRLPPGRFRTLALGVGLAAGVFLPLVLHSVLPDSTMPFGAIVLAACLLGSRILRSIGPDDAADAPGYQGSLRERLGWADRRVAGLGVLLGLAALTRNEAIWLTLSWAAVAWWACRRVPMARRVAPIVGAAIPAILVFAPWAVRDWIEFGSPFPGQALTNALSLEGRDIFAWQETPTLARYLDAGLGTLIGLRVTGFVHNIVNVLLLLGIPISAIGLVGLPWTVLGRSWGLPRSPTRRPSEPAPLAQYVRAEPVVRPGAPVLPPGSGVASGGSAPNGLGGSVPNGLGGSVPNGLGGSARSGPSGGGPGTGLGGFDTGLATPAAPFRPGQQADRPPAWMERPTRLDPWVAPATGPSVLAMLVVFAALTFLATTLLFPVATTWGTFLHASAAVQVLLLLSALLALDRLIVEVGRVRGWTRPVAWLGPTLAIAAGALFTVVLLPAFGRDGESVRDRYAALPAALEAAGMPLEIGGAPVITDYPIWLAEETGARALALPDEPPASVLDLARRFPGTKLVVVAEDNEGIWPEVGHSDPQGLACFELVPLELPGTRAYRILCE